MAKKLKALAESKEAKSDIGQLAKTIRDSAQQIWLAGLGAFSKAQDEGGKVFDALVKEGLTLQRRTRAATEERIGSVGEKMSRAAGDLSKQATQSWDRLEQVFEDRVSRALTRLGVPTGREIGELVERVDALNETVQSMTGGTMKRAVRKSSAAKASAQRSTARGVTAAKATPRAAKTASAAKTPRAAKAARAAETPAEAAKAPARRARTAASTTADDGKATA